MKKKKIQRLNDFFLFFFFAALVFFLMISLNMKQNRLVPFEIPLFLLCADDKNHTENCKCVANNKLCQLLTFFAVNKWIESIDR